MRQWRTPSEAYQHGFRDGFQGEHDMPERLHSHYELGMISGMVERRALGLVGAPNAKEAADVAASPENRASERV